MKTQDEIKEKIGVYQESLDTVLTEKITRRHAFTPAQRQSAVDREHYLMGYVDALNEKDTVLPSFYQYVTGYKNAVKWIGVEPRVVTATEESTDEATKERPELTAGPMFNAEKMITPDLSKKTVPQLKALAKEKKIPGYSKMKKDDLLKVLIDKR